MSQIGQGNMWFLAQVKPNCHMIAERNLVRQGFSVFMPLQEVTMRARGRFVTKLRPLFPGYLFVAIDGRASALRSVNATLGLARLVCLGREPTLVPDHLIRDLMARCDEASVLQPSEQFNLGDRVAVTRGPFTDFVAIIESTAPEFRVHVLMEILGNHARMTLNARHLRAI